MFEIGKAESTGFDPIPNGLYPAFVDGLEWKASKAGPQYLNVRFKIFGEKYANRVIFNMYNVNHPKEIVKNIAFSQIKEMLEANGVSPDEMNYTSEQELADAVSGVRCFIKVATKTDDYGTKNVIKGYEALDEKQSGASFSAADIPF